MNKIANKICEALKLQGRVFTVNASSIEAEGLKFEITPHLATEDPEQISLSFTPMDEANGARNGLFPVLFMTDHFGKNCDPKEIIARAVAKVRNGGEFTQEIGDWTLKLSQNGGRFILQVY